MDNILVANNVIYYILQQKNLLSLILSPDNLVSTKNSDKTSNLSFGFDKTLLKFMRKTVKMKICRDNIYVNQYLTIIFKIIINL